MSDVTFIVYFELNYNSFISQSQLCNNDVEISVHFEILFLTVDLTSRYRVFINI
jgi:hypothetical protein